MYAMAAYIEAKVSDKADRGEMEEGAHPSCYTGTNVRLWSAISPRTWSSDRGRTMNREPSRSRGWPEPSRRNHRPIAESATWQQMRGTCGAGEETYLGVESVCKGEGHMEERPWSRIYKIFIYN